MKTETTMTDEQRTRYDSSGAANMRKVLAAAQERQGAAELEFQLRPSPGTFDAAAAAKAAADHCRHALTRWVAWGHLPRAPEPHQDPELRSMREHSLIYEAMAEVHAAVEAAVGGSSFERCTWVAGGTRTDLTQDEIADIARWAFREGDSGLTALAQDALASPTSRAFLSGQYVRCAEGCGAPIRHPELVAAQGFALAAYPQELPPVHPTPIAHLDCDHPEEGVLGAEQGYRPSGVGG